MERANDMSFGSAFERTFVALIAIATALVLIFLAIQGPLMRGAITYKTDPTINNQLVGQDAVNIGLMGPLLILGGIGLFLRKRWAKDLLIATPLFLIYYAISYTVGWEWSSSTYTGTSERYFFHFLFVLIAALIILLYTLAVFPKNVVSRFRKGGLAIYSAVFVLFLLVFAGMWIQEVRQVITTGEPVLNFEMSGTTEAQPGVLRSWITSWAPLKEADGHVSGVSVVVEEVTERKRLDQALRQSEVKYRRLHESMTDAFVQVAMDGRIVEFNHAYETLSGYSAAERHHHRAALQGIARRPAPGGIAAGVEDQVVTPGHADQRPKTAQRHQEGTALDRASLDQVGLHPADDTLQVHQQP